MFVGNFGLLDPDKDPGTQLHCLSFMVQKDFLPIHLHIFFWRTSGVLFCHICYLKFIFKVEELKPETLLVKNNEDQDTVEQVI